MIRVRVEGLRQTMAAIAGQQKQLRYATAVALTKTARAIKDALPNALEKSLDRPTNFTKRGIFVKAANRDNLTAVVGFMDKQAAYLKWQIEGGTRQPTKSAQRLPTAIQLDNYGNLPRGIIAQLVAVARKEGKLAKRTSRRIKVSNKVDLFYGDPADVGGHKFPPGIYKIVDLGNRKQLVPLIVFPKIAVRYKKRFDLQRVGEDVANREWQRQFAQAWAEAQRTTR